MPTAVGSLGPVVVMVEGVLVVVVIAVVIVVDIVVLVDVKVICKLTGNRELNHSTTRVMQKA